MASHVREVKDLRANFLKYSTSHHPAGSVTCQMDEIMSSYRKNGLV